METIARRIRNMVIAMPYGLETMLGLMDIQESEDIKTACVPLQGRPRILINPKFVEECCQTDEKLFMLVQHELHHILLGHTRLFQRHTKIDNIAFDAIINAMLSRVYRTERWTALFRDTYSASIFPWCLLRPPENFPEQPVYPKEMPQEIQNLITTLYYSNQGTFLEIFETVKILMNEYFVLLMIGDGLENSDTEDNQTSIPASGHGSISDYTDSLLGNHDQDTRGLEADDDSTMFNIVRKIVEEWGQPPDPVVGRSLGDILQAMTLQNIRKHKPVDILKKMIREASTHGDKIPGRFPHNKEKLLTQFHPSRDRRGFAQISLGIPIPTYQHLLQIPEQLGNPVPVYIDVSGSMLHLIQIVLSAVISTLTTQECHLYLFSTVIIPTTITELQKGNIQTNNGTSGEVVYKHILENKYKSAVIITDGYVGQAEHNFVEKLKNIPIYVVLTKNGYIPDMKPIAKKMVILDA